MSLVPSDQDHGGSRSRMEKTHLNKSEAWVWGLKVMGKKRQAGFNLGCSERYMTGIHITLGKKGLSTLGCPERRTAEFLSSTACSDPLPSKALADDGNATLPPLTAQRNCRGSSDAGPSGSGGRTAGALSIFNV